MPQPEIGQIVKKRSAFEYRVNSRHCRPAHFSLYAQWEINLQTLWRTRAKRMGLKGKAMPRSKWLMSLLARGTQKFPGHIGLWMQYISYLRKENHLKKTLQVLTDALRLNTTKAELWICMASYHRDVEADFTTARAYMQRGLRFCNTSLTLWLAYARLEMEYLRKLLQRRMVLGIDGTDAEPVEKNENEVDIIRLPDLVEHGLFEESRRYDTVDEKILQKIQSAPAMAGAIPIAIFDEAMKVFVPDEGAAMSFFDLFAEFPDVEASQKILQHITSSMRRSHPNSLVTAICEIRLPLERVGYTSKDFPAALTDALNRIQAAISAAPDQRASILKEVIILLSRLLRHGDLAEDVRSALQLSVTYFISDLKQTDHLAVG